MDIHERQAIPRRSVLYIPGANDRALDKGRSLPSDALILDLEDSVAPHRKEEARQAVVKALRDGGYGHRELVARVNGIDTPWFEDDLSALASAPVGGVLFPKVDGPRDLERAADSMRRCGMGDSVAVWIMAETPLGMLNVAQTCQTATRVDCVVAGTSDLAGALRVPHTPGRLGLLTALSMCVLAARACGADVLDGVHLDLADTRGFQKACEQGRNLGFDGKTLIHPDQIEIANTVFSPTLSELERARRTIVAFDDALAAGSGVAVVDGRLVENLHVEEAKRVLALERLIESRAV